MPRVEFALHLLNITYTMYYVLSLKSKSVHALMAAGLRICDPIFPKFVGTIDYMFLQAQSIFGKIALRVIEK